MEASLHALNCVLNGFAQRRSAQKDFVGTFLKDPETETPRHFIYRGYCETLRGRAAKFLIGVGCQRPPEGNPCTIPKGHCSSLGKFCVHPCLLCFVASLCIFSLRPPRSLRLNPPLWVIVSSVQLTALVVKFP